VSVKRSLPYLFTLRLVLAPVLGKDSMRVCRQNRPDSQNQGLANSRLLSLPLGGMC
jgi:hypothetical protein